MSKEELEFPLAVIEKNRRVIHEELYNFEGRYSSVQELINDMDCAKHIVDKLCLGREILEINFDDSNLVMKVKETDLQVIERLRNIEKNARDWEERAKTLRAQLIE